MDDCSQLGSNGMSLIRSLVNNNRPSSDINNKYHTKTRLYVKNIVNYIYTTIVEETFYALRHFSL